MCELSKLQNYLINIGSLIGVLPYLIKQFKKLYSQHTIYNFYTCKLIQPRLNIFLAEDDEDDRDFFQKALVSLSPGHNLTVVNNGEEAIRVLKNGDVKPDYIFLDINMPKIDGLGCLQFIKQNFPGHTFPVIMLSTALTADLSNQCYQQGASVYVQKPARFDELKDILRYCIPELARPVSEERVF